MPQMRIAYHVIAPPTAVYYYVVRIEGEKAA